MFNIRKKVVGIFDKSNRAAEAKYKKAINELKNLNDRELNDIGILRSNIEFAVRHGLATNDRNYDQNSAA